MDKTVGILGGGQLGLMLSQAAQNLNIRTLALDPSPSAPAKQISFPGSGQHITGSFKEPSALRRLAEQCDVLTVEIEHVDTATLKEIASQGKVEVQPSPETIEIIQDKYRQKEWLSAQEIAVAKSVAVGEGQDDAGEVRKAVMAVGGFPAVLKSRREAYDGRGNYVLSGEADVEKALKVLPARGTYVEAWADFEMELAVMVVKVDDRPSRSGSVDWEYDTLAFPTVETVHQDSICKLVFAPARDISADILACANALARQAVAGFKGRGVFGVEMFLMNDGQLLVNEIAPRPHNSGHYTIEACAISQYEAHLRAILNSPLSREDLEADRAAVMLNILGGRDPDTHLRVAKAALNVRRAAIHLYGKGDGRPGRKMGHVTVTATTVSEAEEVISPLIKLVDEIRAEARQPQTTANSALALQRRPRPVVAVTMGSDSDLNVLLPGIRLLEEFGVPFHTTITSAHRTPERMFQFAKEAESKGIQVIIAAAGGAAHLPGMIAAISPLPVIGVPVKASTLDGWDSLLSIVQMPKGCPVATVAINNSLNAAQLAIRILARSDATLNQKLQNYLGDQTTSVEEKAGRMESIGAEAYSSQMK